MNKRLRQALVAPDGPLAGETLEQVHPVGGGCIHQAWRLTLSGGHRLFAKSGSEQEMPMFEAEAAGLSALHAFADTDLLEVPKPLALQQLGRDAVLVLPWLELTGADQSALGRGLAMLHQRSERSATASGGRFGWHRDGFIGAGPQPGGWCDSWGQCFVELRLRPQLDLMGSGRWDMECGDLDPLMTAVADQLNRLDPDPCLVHGDLWGGNAGTVEGGRGSLFDPAVWWADREVDLAMTRLFGGFSRAFYEAYDDVLPAVPGADERVDLYNLYHLLNHANLFGGGYVRQCEVSLKRLASQLI